MSYCGERLSGIRQWQGDYIDVPVMGYVNSEATAGYCENGDIPNMVLQEKIWIFHIIPFLVIGL